MQKFGKRLGLRQVDGGTRKVAPNYGPAAVLTYVDEGGGTLVFEYDAERLVPHMLGFDPRVCRTPDFQVERADGREVVVDVMLEGYVGGDAQHERRLDQ